MTGKGHNGPPRGVDITAEYVASAVARLERLDADKAAINEEAVLRASPRVHVHEAA